MERLCKKERRKFSGVTLGASVVAASLWVAAATISLQTNNFYNFIIVGFVALLVNGVALQSAKLEGFEASKQVKK